jgi:hypothetical protein
LEQALLTDRYIVAEEQINSVLTNDMKYDESAIETYRNRSLLWLKNAIDG